MRRGHPALGGYLAKFLGDGFLAYFGYPRAHEDPLPNTPERTQQELSLQIAVGTPLMATRGWSAPEVARVYERARDLCQQVGETPQLFPVLWGLWLFHVSQAQLEPARDLGERLLALAQRTQDSALLLQAHHALGATYLFLAEWSLAQTALEHGMACYDPEQHRSHAFLYGGHDPGSCCCLGMAWAQWMLGYPDQAVTTNQRALAQAQELSHTVSLIHVLTLSAVLQQVRRDAGRTRAQAEAAMALAAEQGSAQYEAMGSILRGWAVAEQGDGGAAIVQVRQFLTASRNLVTEVYRPYFLALLAEMYRTDGQPEQGLLALSEALAAVDDTGVHLYEPEMYRLKGELLLARDGKNEAGAEVCFRQAAEIARHQQSKSLELRAVTSWSRLLQRQSKREEARRMLAEVYGWFTEGFDTPDLKEAKSLLDELSRD